MSHPNPSRIMQAMNGHHLSAALKAAIDLGIFTAIGAGFTTADDLAQQCQASPKGMRILCDYMVVCEFLTKTGNQYGLTPDTAMFLDRRSPAYFGAVASFMSGGHGIRRAFDDLTTVVRQGGTMLNEQNGTMSRENPVWDEFARSMVAVVAPAAEAIAKAVNAEDGSPMKVLDIAAGHGLFGMTIADQNPNAHIHALDWASVLAIAHERAASMGVLDRWTQIEGSAFEEDFGSDYDVILITNFHHHFDTAKIEGLMRKAHAALKSDGVVVTLEFIPNDDRVTPPEQAAFALIMLATTGEGDAYTFAEYDRIYRSAGFAHNTLIRLDAAPESLIISRK